MFDKGTAMCGSKENETVKFCVILRACEHWCVYLTMN
jgi:hypothetical protein